MGGDLLEKKHHSCVFFFTSNLNDDQNTCNNTWIKSIYNEYYHKPWDILFSFHVYFNSFLNVYINVISTALLKIQCDVHFPSVIWKLKMYPVSDHTFSLHFKLQSILSCLFMEPSFSLITKQKTKHIQSNETSCNKLPTYYIACLLSSYLHRHISSNVSCSNNLTIWMEANIYYQIIKLQIFWLFIIWVLKNENR